jgi:signal transduction histidine kinase
MPDYIGRLDDISGIIDEEINMYRKDIEERKLTVNIQVEKDLTLMIDGKHFSTLINNLVKNAIIYNKKNGMIDIRIDTY